MRTQTRDLPGRFMAGQIPFSLLTQYPYRVYNSPESEVNRMDDTCSCHNESPCACCKTKLRSEQELRDLINRLSRIEGQIRGIRSMVEKDAYCIDILTQVSAASAALSSFTRVLLANHIKTCVAQDIRDGKDETIDELVGMLQKLMR